MRLQGFHRKQKRFDLERKLIDRIEKLNVSEGVHLGFLYLAIKGLTGVPDLRACDHGEISALLKMLGTESDTSTLPKKPKKRTTDNE